MGKRVQLLHQCTQISLITLSVRVQHVTAGIFHSSSISLAAAPAWFTFPSLELQLKIIIICQSLLYPAHAPVIYQEWQALRAPPMALPTAVNQMLSLNQYQQTDVRLHASEGERGQGCKGINQIILSVVKLHNDFITRSTWLFSQSLAMTQASWWKEQEVLWCRQWAAMTRWAVRERQRSSTHSRALCQHALDRAGIPEWHVTVLSWQMGVLRWSKWSAVPSQTLGKYISTGCVHIARLRVIKRKSSLPVSEPLMKGPVILEHTLLMSSKEYPISWWIYTFQFYITELSSPRAGVPKHVPGASLILHILHVSLCMTHLFQVLELLLMSWWVESGVIDKVAMQKVQCWWGSRNEFGRGQKVNPTVDHCTTLTAAAPGGQLKHHKSLLSKPASEDTILLQY